MIELFIISLCLGLVLILSDFMESLIFKLFSSFLALSGFSLTTLCSLVLRKRKDRKIFTKIGVGISLIGFIYTILLVWNVIDYNNQIILNTFLSLITLSFFIGYICLLLFVKNSFSSINISRNSSVLLLIFLTTLLFINIWIDIIPIKLILAVILLLIICTLLMMMFISLHDTESKVKVYEKNKYQKMDELKELLDTSVISREQFDEAKDKILGDNKKKK